MTRDLAAICGACNFPVGDGGGYLSVRYAEINRVTRESAEWHAAHPGAVDMRELLAYPDEASWTVYHAKCDPRPDEDAYQIDVERIRTWAQLTHWTAHLMGKNWLADTDWDELLEAASNPENRTRITSAPALRGAA